MKRRRASLVHVLPVKTVGEPPTGNLYKRFDEGNGLTPVPTLLCSVGIVFMSFSYYKITKGVV